MVVPTYGRRASLGRLLDALAAQQGPADFEVVVVDDGSMDDTRAWLRALRTPYALHVVEQANGGPAAARNRGVVDALGELIIFLDDDVVPAADLIAKHREAHRDWPDRVVTGPMLPPAKWRRPSWIRWEETKLVRQYDAMAAQRFECTYRQFFTGNASLRRSHFLAAGGFDTDFRRAEDIELGYRLARRGLRFVFEPSARAWHYPTRSFGAWRQTPYRYGRAEVAMHRDKGSNTLTIAYRELQGRHMLSRTVVALCAGSHLRSRLAAAAFVGVVHAAGFLRAEKVASLSLSALFNLLYWQGVHDELEGTPRQIDPTRAADPAS
ncbi:MAG TPA: glycosyltransferase family 2 protein [Candidatus Limnocylindria bacterium]